MRITLVRPPFYSLVGMNIVSHPLSLGYLSSCLTSAGEDVCIVDGEVLDYGKSDDEDKSSFLRAFLFEQKFHLFSNTGSQEEHLEKVMNDYYHNVWNVINEELIKTKPDVIGITCFTVTMTSVKIIVKRIKESFPDVKIVLGGVHVTTMAEETLRSIAGVSCVVIGEGEETLVELVNEYKKGDSDLERVDGLAFLSKDGTFIRTKARALIQNLESLPLPTRSWGDLKYEDHLGFTSRGCPYKCNFCDSRSIWTRAVRYLPLERVMDELDHVVNLGLPVFRYADDTFPLNRARTLEWCKLVKEGGYNNKMKFRFGSRVELITRESVEEYLSAGVESISFGIETGSKRIGKIISKDFKSTDPVEAVKLVNDIGINTRTYFMLGHPTETAADIEDTISMVKKMCSLPRNFVEVNVVCPYPGTELWPLALEKSGGGNFVDIDTYYKMFHQNSPVVNLTDLPNSEIDKYIREVCSMVARRSIKNKLTSLSKRMLTNPVSTIKLIKNRYR